MGRRARACACVLYFRVHAIRASGGGGDVTATAGLCVKTLVLSRHARNRQTRMCFVGRIARVDLCGTHQRFWISPNTETVLAQIYKPKAGAGARLQLIAAAKVFAKSRKLHAEQKIQNGIVLSGGGVKYHL